MIGESGKLYLAALLDLFSRFIVGWAFGSGVRIDTIFTFEPVPAGTKVSIEFELQPEGLPPGLLRPLEWAIGGKVRHVLSDDLQDLKTSIEKIVKA